MNISTAWLLPYKSVGPYGRWMRILRERSHPRRFRETESEPSGWRGMPCNVNARLTAKGHGCGAGLSALKVLIELIEFKTSRFLNCSMWWGDLREVPGDRVGFRLWTYRTEPSTVDWVVLVFFCHTCPCAAQHSLTRSRVEKSTHDKELPLVLSTSMVLVCFGIVWMQHCLNLVQFHVIWQFQEVSQYVTANIESMTE